MRQDRAGAHCLGFRPISIVSDKQGSAPLGPSGAPVSWVEALPCLVDREDRLHVDADVEFAG